MGVSLFALSTIPHSYHKPLSTSLSMDALEFFSGIGGLHAALAQVQPESHILASFDINPNAYLV